MILVKSPSDAMSYRVYVSQIGTANITTAAFVAAGLTFGGAIPDNNTTPKSVVVAISGGTHGAMYQAQGTFNLDVGGPLVRPVAVRVINA